MGDYGFRVLRDACGEHSKPDTIDRDWDLGRARRKMLDAAEKEVQRLRETGSDPVTMVRDEDTIEIREGKDHRLVACYEVEEFEHV